MAARKDLARNDLARIGVEAFALIEEHYDRPRRRPRQVVPAPPQPVVAIQPPKRMVESSPPIRCDQLAKAHGGIIIKEWGGKRVNKVV
ncbi:hypothetical protein E5676_scaffold209G001240 [Cucumis melo var. makuwa]|uniref:Uncharacterized protein n=2 Tax=Cucumis melo TaxID=3656 RepID=A0A5A7U5Q5_CUCMM|nr:hypothetical protein E6C27_scaffold171G007700 [Cucumis melo var. makuwa]TYK16196.1 hypothetical protein E5676_scaffold209G001240 [Cucumis melo var. makuwa]